MRSNRIAFATRTSGDTIRTLAVSLIGAAALAAGLVLIRQHREHEAPRLRDVPPGETVPAEISLDRLRAQGY